MEKIFNGKTLQEAKDKMYEYFESKGVNEDNIDTQILEQPVKKLFGGMKGEYKINAIVSDELVNRHTDAGTVESQTPSTKAADLASNILNSSETKKVNTNTPSEISGNTAPVSMSSEGHSIIINYLSAILTGLGASGFSINVIEKENITVFDIIGDKLGIAIGRRGETLDALQYLAILASNRGGMPFSRISVDCNGYRSKRTETLESLAVRTAKKVLAQGKRITLEPMNPYERRVIHGKVSEIEGVYSSSTGDEPFRKVVISASVPKHRRGGSGRDSRDNRGNQSKTPNYSDRPSYKQSSGFRTSFERDYKRAKSEDVEISQDSLDFEKSTSLYGKIEL